MGASASLNPEVFSAAKAEYELKKNEGLTDEQLFNHMKSFIESKSKENSGANSTLHPTEETPSHIKTQPEQIESAANSAAVAT